MAEKVSEAHDGVLSILDQMRLGPVSNVLLVSFVRTRIAHQLTTCSPAYEMAQAICLSPSSLAIQSG